LGGGPDRQIRTHKRSREGGNDAENVVLTNDICCAQAATTDGRVPNGSRESVVPRDGKDTFRKADV
jgi:hypothetical protein